MRAIGVAGEFVEFFGPGVSTLCAGERSVVANMAPEYGATTGFFAVDARTLEYFRATGRDAAQVQLVEAYVRRTGLWFDPDATPHFTRTIEIDLGRIGMHIAGPKRPQDLLDVSQARATLAALGFQRKATHQHSEDPSALRAAGLGASQRPGALIGQPPGSALRYSPLGRPGGLMPRHPIAIAAITSCTNTTDPALLIAAGLVARKARQRGLKVPPRAKTSLGPGSPAAAAYLQRAGLIDDLSAVGFDIVGFGCTTCIGNSGPLPDAIRVARDEGSIHPVAVPSGNRNFPGRVHPDMDLGFLMSPPLVIAFALAGDAEIDLTQEPIAFDAQHRPVHLADLWPSREEVAAALAMGADPADFKREFAIASRNPGWHALEAPDSPRFPWNPASTALRRPPFASVDQGSQLGRYAAYPLLVVGDDITTDHISPASAIPPDSLVADFLVERGDDRDELEVELLRAGGVMPSILKKTIATQETS